MDLTEKSSRQSLIPSFLYASSSAKIFGLEKMHHASPSTGFNTNVEAVSQTKGLVIPSPTEPSKKIEMYSPAFNDACIVGGILRCVSLPWSYFLLTSFDLIKCNMQAIGCLSYTVVDCSNDDVVVEADGARMRASIGLSKHGFNTTTLLLYKESKRTLK